MRTKSELVNEKNKDLLRVFNAVQKQKELKSIREGVMIAINSPSSRFWITSEQATRMMSKLNKGDELENIAPIRKKMFMELYKRYKELRDTEEYAQSPISHICEIIVESPAPCFYMKLGTAIKRIKRQREIEQCRKISLLL